MTEEFPLYHGRTFLACLSGLDYLSQRIPRTTNGSVIETYQRVDAALYFWNLTANYAMRLDAAMQREGSPAVNPGQMA